MDCVLYTSSNVREEEDINIDDFNFQDRLEVVIDYYGDNIDDEHIKSMAVIDKFQNQRIQREIFLVKINPTMGYYNVRLHVITPMWYFP